MRSFKYAKGATLCPKCGNKNKFDAHSSQVAEDCCEVWVSCHICGYDPTEAIIGNRVESVMGGTDNGNVLMAIDVWNESIEEAPEENAQ